MTKTHQYRARITWSGNQGSGTSAYAAYSRNHEITAQGRAPIAGSSDPAFRGDATKWNPELLLLASISACHKLWYLHLCAEAGIIVTAYQDNAEAEMQEESDGGGQISKATLHPHATLGANADYPLASHLHNKAHQFCFIARSVNFPITILPTFARQQA